MNNTGVRETSSVISTLRDGGHVNEYRKGCCWYIRRAPEVMQHISYYAMVNNELSRQIAADWSELMTDIGLPGVITLGEEGTTSLQNFIDRNHEINLTVSSSTGGYGVLEFGEEHLSENLLGAQGENYPKLMAHTFFRYLWCKSNKIPKVFSKLKRTATPGSCSNWDILKLAVICCDDVEDPGYGAINKVPLSWDTVDQFRESMRSPITSIQKSFVRSSSLPNFMKLSSFTFAKDTPIYLLQEAIKLNMNNIQEDLIASACDQIGRVNVALENIDTAIENWDNIDDFDYDIKIFSDKFVGVWINMDTFEDEYIVLANY